MTRGNGLRWAVMAILAGTMLVSCSSSDPAQVESSAPTTASDWSNVSDDNGVGGGGQALAWTGHVLFAFGGVQHDSGSPRATGYTNDAAIYDPAAGRWKPVPRAPFDAPLLSPAAVAIGTDVIVVGSPCPSGSATGSAKALACTPKGLDAARFDSEANVWHDASPTDVESAGPPTRAVGSTGGEAVFQASGRLLAYSPNDDKWRLLAAPPFDSWTDACAANGLVTAFAADNGFSALPPGSQATETANQRAATRNSVMVSFFDTNGGAWSPPSTAPRSVPGTELMQATCDGPVGVALPNVVKGAVPADVIVAPDRTWRQAPAIDIGPVTPVSTTWTGNELLVVGVNGAFGYNPESNTWRSLPPPFTRNPAATVWVEAGLVLLDAGGHFALYTVPGS